MKQISVFSKSTDAETTLQGLARLNIQASLTSEDLSGKGSVSVLQVDEAHMKEALNAMEGDLGSLAIKCPQCASAHLAYPNQPEFSPTAALAEKIAETLKFTERTFFCHDCQFEWSSNTPDPS